MTQQHRQTRIDQFIVAQALPDAFRSTVEKVHQPLATAIAQYHAALRRPCVVGLCGPQGSGKSTGAAVLRLLLELQGLRVVILSIDDLYLTRAERQGLAQTVHPLLGTRGPPGSHDVAMGIALLDRLKAPGPTVLPSFDKAADDQRSSDQLSVFEGPADVILFEGWCIGARAQPPGALEKPINVLEREDDPDGTWRRYVNNALANYRPLFARIDFQILLLPPSFGVVARWRQEQEAKLRQHAKSAGTDTFVMSDDEITRFVQHYERLTRYIIAEMPMRAHAIVKLGPDRELEELVLK